MALPSSIVVALVASCQAIVLQRSGTPVPPEALVYGSGARPGDEFSGGDLPDGVLPSPLDFAKSTMEAAPPQEEAATDESLAASAAEPDIHVAMFTERQRGAGPSFQSICANTAQPSRLHFHLLAPWKAGWKLEDMAPACADGGAQISVYSFNIVAQSVRKAGFNWTYAEAASNAWIRPGQWDNSSSYSQHMNLLRFYLPLVQPFANLSSLILVDDDVIIQKDIALAWNHQIKKGAVMTASCQNWVWTNCKRFESSTSLSYLDVPYLGFGQISGKRSLENASCSSRSEKECLPKGFLEMLRKQSARINGPEGIVSPKTLSQTSAWHLGFNKLDLDAWRLHNMSQKLTDWLNLNSKNKIFPETSLSFGLGLAMLASLGRVQCFDETTPFLQGLGFVGPHDMRMAGFNESHMENAFGVHFNGPRKPWDTEMASPFRKTFLKYATQDVVRASVEADVRLRQRKLNRAMQNFTSFVVLTDPRAGADWFMDMLDQHPSICTKGESEDGAGVPERYGKLASLLGIGARSGASRSFDHGSKDLFKAVGDHPKEWYVQTASQRMLSCRQSNTTCTWAGLAELVWKASRNPALCGVPAWTDLTERLDEFEEEGKTVEENATTNLTNTPAPVAAAPPHRPIKSTWDAEFTLGLLQNATPESQTFRLSSETTRTESFYPRSGTADEVLQNTDMMGVCMLAKRSVKNLKDRGLKVTKASVSSESFNVYFRHQMRYSLLLGDAPFGTNEEAAQITPCKCHRDAVVTGQKLMHDWIGDHANTSEMFANWRERPWEINFNAPNAAEQIGAPFLDLFGGMKELGTRVIWFERRNWVARYVSSKLASGAVRCETQECEDEQASRTIQMDVEQFRTFRSWQESRHSQSKRLLQEAGIQVLTLYEEDCVDSPRACIKKALAFLDVPKGPSSEAEERATARAPQKTRARVFERIANYNEAHTELARDGMQHLLAQEFID